MKKDLKISGKIELTRQEVVQIIAEYVKENHGLQLEKAVSVNKDEQPIDFENLICYVHQADKELITKKYDPPQKHKVPIGIITRPNYGIGPFLRELLDDEKIWGLSELLKECRQDKFKDLTVDQLEVFLRRKDTVGVVKEVNGYYQKLKKDNLI